LRRGIDLLSPWPREEALAFVRDNKGLSTLKGSLMGCMALRRVADHIPLRENPDFPTGSEEYTVSIPGQGDVQG
jgi:hypothetical protein